MIDNRKKAAYIVLLILTLTAISVFYIINNTNTAVQAYPEGSFIPEEPAFKIAESKFRHIIIDDLLRGIYWKNSELGTPILIKDIYEQPVYWNVPIEYENKFIGHIDINGDGTVLRYGMYYPNLDNLSETPPVVSEMPLRNVKDIAKNITIMYSNCMVSEPMLVYYEFEDHEEAWMFTVRNSEGIVSRIYVTPTYIFEDVSQKFYDDTGMCRQSRLEVGEPYITGIYFAFEQGVTESEVKSILDDYIVPAGYNLKYDITYMRPHFYVVVDRNNVSLVEQKLLKTRHYKWSDAQPSGVFIKPTRNGSHSIIGIEESTVTDSDVLEILGSHNLRLEKFVWCYVGYTSEAKKWNSTRNDIINRVDDKDKILYLFFNYSTGHN